MTASHVLRRAGRGTRCVALLVALLAAIAAHAVRPVSAQPVAPPPAAPAAVVPDTADDLTVDLVTIGQGDAVWEKFGHNAIVITDRRTGTSVAWNWGIFDFDQPGFLGRFLKGNMRYRMDGFSAEASLAYYTSANRTVWQQRLALLPVYKRKLRALILENARPENREYTYDYFLDNCSTRVRNLLNEAMGGGLAGWTRHHYVAESYRSTSQRLVADNPFTELGLTMALGVRADSLLTMWDEAFVPMRLQARVRELLVEDGRGGIRPLVSDERALFTATRPPEAPRPPRLWPWTLAIGMLCAALLGWCLYGDLIGSGNARGALAAFGTAWLLLSGIVGVILLLAATVTGHVYWQQNPSAYLCSFLALVAAPAYWRVVRRPESSPAWHAVALVAPLVAAYAIAHWWGAPLAARAAVVSLTVPMHLALVVVIGAKRGQGRRPLVAARDLA